MTRIVALIPANRRSTTLMKNIKQSVGAVIGALALAAATVVGVQSAHATGGDPEPCVPSEAWTEEVIVTPAVPGQPEVTEEQRTGWQRYSWTGGPHDSDTPPSFPSSDWQPNVAGDPHGIGEEGAYFRSHGGSGKGDWFYLEGIYETVVVTPAVDPVPAVIEYVEHPAVTCEDDPTDEPTPTDPTDDPTPQEPTEEPETPTDEPTDEPTEDDPTEPEGDTSSQSIKQRCLAAALVTETFEDGQRVSVSTENGHPRCAPEPGDQPIIEEGM